MFCVTEEMRRSPPPAAEAPVDLVTPDSSVSSSSSTLSPLPPMEPDDQLLPEDNLNRWLSPIAGPSRPRSPLFPTSPPRPHTRLRRRLFPTPAPSRGVVFQDSDDSDFVE